MAAFLHKLLKEVMGEEAGVDEAAATPQQARSEGLALITGKSHAILVNPENIIEAYHKEVKKEMAWRNAPPHVKVEFDKWDRSEALADALYKAKAIVGYISFSKSSIDKDVWEIMQSAATKKGGYGPLLYDMALSLVSPGWLISDRHSVSPHARKVWSYYLQYRPDVEKALLPALKYEPGYPVGGLPNSVRSDDVARDDFHRSVSEKELFEDDYNQVQQEYNSIKKLYQREANKKNGGNTVILADLKRELTKLYKTLKRMYKELEAANKEMVALKSKAVDQNPFFYKYRIKKPIAVSQLKANANRMVSKLMEVTKLSQQDVVNALIDAGQNFFDDRFS